MRLSFLVAALLLVVSIGPACASLTPDDVVVVYNASKASDGYDWSVSKRIADYYCKARGIPMQNEFGVVWPSDDEEIKPTDFFSRIAAPLKAFLSARAGATAGAAPDLASDPTKCIVLCHGIPLGILGNERTGSVDAALTMIFSDCPWGREPIGSFNSSTAYEGGFMVANPYSTSSTDGFDPSSRTRAADFVEFRRSDDNRLDQGAPGFTVVRMLDASHALAAGQAGILYRGELSGGSWTWTAVPDSQKYFICHRINDVSVFDSQHAWVCSEAGSLIQTSNGGRSWSGLRSAWINYPVNSPILAISMFSANDGWVIGNDGALTSSGTQYTPYIRRYGDWFASRIGDLPKSFTARSIAAASADEAWISGSGGIYHTTNGSQTNPHWTQVYGSSTGDICVKNNVGWAVASNGDVLRTTDGANWTVAVGSPTIPSDSAKMSVYDATHLAIACGSEQIWLYDGSSWTASAPGATSASAAWAGGNAVVAVDAGPSVIRSGNGRLGSLTWSQSHSVATARWNLRYLVSRLDGYPTPVDDKTGIPLDVKNLIDRATRANGAGASALADAKVVLDDPWSSREQFTQPLRTLIESLVGTSDLVYDSTSKYITGGYTLPNGARLDQSETIAYSSSGCYHPNGHESTTWWRPFLKWKDGAIAMFKWVSYDMRTLRSPAYLTGLASSTSVEPGKLKVKINGVTSLYDKHWIGLYSGNDRLRRANLSNGTATIDLDGIAKGSYYVELHFPDDDPLNPSERIGRQPIVYGTSDTGLAYTWNVGQSLDAELIRDGCSGTIGNIYEPFASGCPEPETILPQYINKRTWAESAYMGLPFLGWQEIVIGDPLMAPYQPHPSLSFVSPTSPADGSRVRGQVSIEATAAPDGDGSIEKVEFRLVSGQTSRLLSADTQPPYECVWDSEASDSTGRAYPDGDYTIQATAYQTGASPGSSTASCSVALDTTGVPVCAISEPKIDGAIVSVSTPAVAQPSGEPSNLEFWLFGRGSPIRAGAGSSSPYQCPKSPSATTDGLYQLQAIAYYDNPASASYSPRRSVLLISNTPVYTSAASLSRAADGSQLVLANMPVVAGSSPITSGAFYVEDPTRTAGVRVQSAESIAAGRLVSVMGTFHKTGVDERYIEASDIFDMGPCTPPGALGMPTRSVGCATPATADDDSQKGGIYSVGLLTNTWGRVTYVGDDFVYIDDGSRLQDGNALKGPVVVPLNGKAIPSGYPPARGLRICCGGLDKPGIGDHVWITGVSSLMSVNGDAAPCLLLRSQTDIAYARRYEKYAQSDYTTNGAQLPLGSSVRLVDCDIWKNWGNYFEAAIQDPGGHNWNALVDAVTLLPGQDEYATVTGKLVAYEPYPRVVADGVYLGGSAYGALMRAASAMSSHENGPSRELPYQIAVDRLLTGERFRRMYSGVGTVGWALSQSHDAPVLWDWFEAIRKTASTRTAF